MTDKKLSRSMEILEVVIQMITFYMHLWQFISVHCKSRFHSCGNP